MILTGNEDLRVRKTITSIRKNFSDMLLEMPYEKITVKALCARALINKKTFYTYYDTLDALLSELLDEMTRGCLDRFKEFIVPRDLEKINREFFRYSVEQGELFERIVCAAPFQYIGGRMITRLVRQTWEGTESFRKLPRVEQKILFSFICTVGLESFRQWVADGKRVPLEDIIHRSSTLLCRGVFGFFEQTSCSD